MRVKLGQYKAQPGPALLLSYVILKKVHTKFTHGALVIVLKKKRIKKSTN